MARLITGIVAHVDAGKTTLSEALLYETGAIRTLGRVDSKNAFLDNNSIERDRGITIFSKQAVLNDKITLIDTPGHVDFSAEMERSLSVLDAAILLINASDGVQSHTKTLWSLLQQHKIPTVIFVNKMDMPGTEINQLLEQLKAGLSENIINFNDCTTPAFFEEIAGCDDSLTEKFLEGQNAELKDITRIIKERKVFPCIFGSALKMDGVNKLLQILETYFEPSRPENEDEFGAIVYKISKDKMGNRLTHLKITGGCLKVKENLGEEKINEIRIYSGEKYDSVKEVQWGQVCTVTGLKESKAGTIYGKVSSIVTTKMEPALIYSVIPPEGLDTPSFLKIMRELEEELPELKVECITSNGVSEVCMMLMGEVQTQVIQQLVRDRDNIEITFGEGRIAYKETIKEPVIGVGHYEPLRHYAEVQLLLSPRPRGTGMKFISELSVDVLDTNWQRLIMTHLKEKQHIGVLTGSPITDMEIRVVAGRAHLKHTEGGDFRQSTYRAIRHGLMYAKSVLLEPYYKYQIVVPEANTGRVMSDMEKMHGNCNLVENKSGFAVMEGRVPVATMKNYINDVRAFTKGQGTLFFTMDGYEICHNEKEVIEQIGYNPNADLENPASSVFCSHGAGFTVNWDEVNNYKHLTPVPISTNGRQSIPY
ncbi:MAG: TetM/TetW/TetO/TetS family tetracycline resistance ribosomal protection protein [Treponema sp.]|nr:TetM/TetW/TetO/TetS family tetracycline resistance ribosomal protection protein [Treponema sp.]